MKVIKRLIAVVFVVCLLMGLSANAFADFWDLSNGDISINASEAGQTVTQGSTSVTDNDPTIYSSAVTSNTIDVSSDAGVTAEFTIGNDDAENPLTLNLITTSDKNAIDIANGSTVIMNVENDNVVTNTTGSLKNAATIHMADADLTIIGKDDAKLDVNTVGGQYAKLNGAAIGSDGGEHYDGSLAVESAGNGGFELNVDASRYGAAIGGGNGGDFNGSVVISNGVNAHIEAANNAAAIGAGQSGDFSETGSVEIYDSTVYASAYDNGAGIGGGYKGDFNGSVIIENSTVEAYSGYISGNNTGGNGAAIGAGFDGDFGGSVSITNSTVTAISLNNGSGIGGGGVERYSQIPEFAGSVSIVDSNVTAASLDRGTPIGAPESHGTFTGSITVSGNSSLTLIDGLNKELGDEALLGSNSIDPNSSAGSVTIEDTVNVNYWAGERDFTKLTTPEEFTTCLPGAPVKATLDDLPVIAPNAKLAIVIVPKSAPGIPMPDFEAIFWQRVEQLIRNAEPGTVVTIDAKSYTSLPAAILDAITECGVGLCIQWDGGEDIVIPADHGIVLEEKTIDFSELAELLKK